MKKIVEYTKGEMMFLAIEYIGIGIFLGFAISLLSIPEDWKTYILLFVLLTCVATDFVVNKR